MKSEKQSALERHTSRDDIKSAASLTSLDQLIDEYVGVTGSQSRKEFEFELNMDLIGKKISILRKSKGMTQSELGTRIGVKKAQISRLESSARNTTIQTLQKVFNALEVSATIRIEP